MLALNGATDALWFVSFFNLWLDIEDGKCVQPLHLYSTVQKS